METKEQIQAAIEKANRDLEIATAYYSTSRTFANQQKIYRLKAKIVVLMNRLSKCEHG